MVDTLIVATDCEPTEEIKKYLSKVVTYTGRKKGIVSVLSRPGISDWIVKGCKLNNISVRAFRWLDMPYLPGVDIKEIESSTDKKGVADSLILPILVKEHDIIVGAYQGNDVLPHLATMIGSMQGKETRLKEVKE